MSHDNKRHDPRTIPSSLLDPPESTTQLNLDDPLGSEYVGDQLPSSFRHNGWKPDRTRTLHSLLRTEQSCARIHAFRQCGTHPWVFRSKSDPTIYRLGTDKCRDRFCVPCQADRGRTIVSNLIPYLGDRTVRFVTFTLAGTTDPLADRLRDLQTSFSKLRRRALWKRAVAGGIAFLEVKRTKDGQRWHPHLHCIVTGTWIDAKKLRLLWHEITGDSFIVDVQLVRSYEKLARYVVKYVSKPMDNAFIRDEDRLDEAVRALKGRKLVTAWGSFRDLQTSSQADDHEWIPLLAFGELTKLADAGSQWALDLMLQFRDQITAATSHPPPHPDDQDPDTFPRTHGDVHVQSRFDFQGPDAY